MCVVLNYSFLQFLLLFLFPLILSCDAGPASFPFCVGGGGHGWVARICLPLENMQSPFQELATNIGISWMF